MIVIGLLSEHIDDELEDACTYAKLALEYKDTEPELAQLFYKLSGDEMGHMEALHKNVVSHIEAYKKLKGEAPESMKFLYDFVHKREIARAGEVKRLHGLYKGE